MILELREIVYSKKAFISDVPVYACQECSNYELVPEVKEDLVDYLNSIGEVKERVSVSFADLYEPAYILKMLYSSSYSSLPEFQSKTQSAFDERIDMLLDLYRLAKSQSDTAWMKEINDRLEKVISFLQLNITPSLFCKG